MASSLLSAPPSSVDAIGKASPIMTPPYTVEAFYRPEKPDQPALITSPSELDKMIDELLTQPAEYSVATLYVRERPWSPTGFPDHELCIGVDADGGHGVVIYSGANGRGEPGSYLSCNPTGRRDLRHRYHHFHIALVVPAGSDIPLADVRSAAREFLTRGGERPRCLQWRQYRHGPETTR
jgi:hypothetical protein